MRTASLNDTNFQGKVIVLNRLSSKPNRCLNKVEGDMQKLVQKKDYNLYLKQDYAGNLINISAEYPFTQKPSQKHICMLKTQINVPITSKASRYVDTASNVIKQFENNMWNKEQQIWEKEQKKQKIDDVKNIMEYILLSPVFIADAVIHEINPKWGKKFEKLLEKIGI